MAKKDLTLAQQDLDLAIELRPELTSPRGTRAELYVRKGEWENVAHDVLNVRRSERTAHVTATNHQDAQRGEINIKPSMG